jgi:hypothetical protein
MPNIREIKRRSNINKIRNAIKQAKNEDKKVDPEKLISYCMVEFGVSRRTAMEYIRTAYLYSFK